MPMKKLYLLLLGCLFVSLHATGQVRTITGRLTSTEDGSPLPGVSITIKGTSEGTATDGDGNYSIEVPIGSTLVFSFIGMITREVIVTDDNLQPVERSTKQQRKKHNILQPIPRSLYTDSILQDMTGISFLTGESPTYKNNSPISPELIRSIRKRGNTYIIHNENDPIKRTGLGLQFTTAIGIEKINQLPAFQNTYAQGQSQGGSYQWRGGDQQETFSWGPRINNLEFDGSNYAFDKNGALVPAGTGNGKQAKKYDPLSFFRAGVISVNELMLVLPTPKSSTLVTNFEYRTRTGIIPNSDYSKINLSTDLRNFKISQKTTSRISLSYNNSQGNILSRGSNLASIIGAVYRTPATFDNTNGLSAASALRTQDAYEFSDGSKRSHAPGLADNPFGLVNELPDYEKLNRLVASANVTHNTTGQVSLVFNGSIDQQWNKTTFGIPPGYSGAPDGRLTHRDDRQTFANSLITGAFTPYIENGDLKLSLSYQAEYTNRQLKRFDGFNFPSSEAFPYMEEASFIAPFNKTISRTSQEAIINAQYDFNRLFHLRLTNRTYFSNTVDYSQFTNIFPSASLSVDLADELYFWDFYKIKFYVTASRTLREAPLLYSSWAYSSVAIPVENFTTFYEANELFFTNNIAPETERKFETGFEVAGHNGFSAEICYFNNLTTDFIAPVNSNGNYELTNAAAVKNYGVNFSATYSLSWNGNVWGVDLTWGAYKNKVVDFYLSGDRVALAGFQSAQTVLAPGKSVGAIYGTTYSRDLEGRKIIGADGFPVKNSNLSMIGNPIPDWTLGFSSFIQLKRFRFSFTIDVKKGGETWNGTNSVLDYLGRSQTTGKLRGTTDYIFKGVDINGNTNTIPVDFYSANAPVTENRWARYGWDGVGEDYIEDTSWIRLNEVVLSYTAYKGYSHLVVKEIKFSLIGRNLLLITPYTGVDPNTSLFGYTGGNGLDLFNLPATRAFSAQVTLKI